MKKLVTILLVILLFVGCLLANEEIISNLKLKKQIAKFLDKRANNIVKRQLLGEYKYLKLKKLENKRYKDYDVYQAKIRIALNFYYRYNIVVKGDSLYAMPKDFNKLLVDSDNLATNRKKEKEIIRKFIELYLYNDVEIKKIERKTLKIKYIEHNWTTKEKMEKDVTKIKYSFYDYQIETWEKINGIKRLWGISFKDGQIYKRYAKILDVYSGDYIKDSSYDVPSKGASGRTIYNIYKVKKEKNNRDHSMIIKNYKNEIFTFYDSNDQPDGNVKFYEKYVILKENGIAKPDSERTIRIELSGYSAGDIVHIN